MSGTQEKNKVRKGEKSSKDTKKSKSRKSSQNIIDSIKTDDADAVIVEIKTEEDYNNDGETEANGNRNKSIIKYTCDDKLPVGWKYYDSGKKSTYFKNEKGKIFNSRRKALSYMYKKGGYSKDEIYHIRDGLLYEDWSYHDELPPGWMHKQYIHKIEGLDTNILYLLSPSGDIYRSKIKIKRNAKELDLSERDLQQLLNFKTEESAEPKKIENPDDDWYYDENCVPSGWLMKKYCYNSKSKVEEVFHYLSPDHFVLRGRRQVHDYMMRNDSFNQEDFEKFHFCKNNVKPKYVEEPKKIKSRIWTQWSNLEGFPSGWKFRQLKETNPLGEVVQFKAPCGKMFTSRTSAMNYLNSSKGDNNQYKVFSPPVVSRSDENSDLRITLKKVHSKRNSSNNSIETVWDEWRSDEIPCLMGWLFSIGRKGSKRKIRYKSPTGEIFKSRGPLLRYLLKNGLKTKSQLATLKRLLKINQGMPFGQLRKNDKFIKKFDVDSNYLEFIKIRYENESHQHIPEEVDPKLPPGWKKKVINGVDYFKNPTGKFVFNSRRLVVDHLRKQCFELSDDQLLSILEDSESESDLSEEESTEDTDEECYLKEEKLDFQNNLL